MQYDCWHTSLSRHSNPDNHRVHRIYVLLQNIDARQHIEIQSRRLHHKTRIEQLNWLCLNGSVNRTKVYKSIDLKKLTAILLVRSIGAICNVVAALVFSNTRNGVPFIS